MELYSCLWGSRTRASQVEMAERGDVFQALAHLEDTYPNFKSWYFGKVVPSFGEERQIFLTKSNEHILGVAIAKRSRNERKLCTLWTAQTSRHTGIALDLADRAFEWLETSKPLFTVPEERMTEFQGLLRRWNFGQPTALTGYYRERKTEYIFNGHLRAELSA
jgi:hypothetical protein